MMTEIKHLCCDEIHQILSKALQPTQLEVIDDSDAHVGHAGLAVGGHYIIRISSPLFNGKTRVACHRLVYDPLQQFIGQGIHALSIEMV